MAKETIKIPDMGGADGVEIIEICVAVGDTIEAEESLLVLESDKASMEVPAPKGGKVAAIHVKVGDSVSEGDAILDLELEGDTADEAEAEPASSEPDSDKDDDNEEAESESGDAEVGSDEARQSPASDETRVEKITVPDVGGDADVEVIEVCVAEGDRVEEGDALIVLESDKASMEVPSPYSGVISKLSIKVGDSAKNGTPIGEMEVTGGAGEQEDRAESPAEPEKPVQQKPAGEGEKPAAASSNKDAPKAERETSEFKSANPAAASAVSSQGPTVEVHPTVYAGPAVRKLAREFGVELERVSGTGPKGRVVKEDLHDYVKKLAKGEGAAGSASGLPSLPEIDFAQFGPVDVQPRSKLHKLTATNMHRSWVNLPHVTQFDDADITELEDFRAGLKAEAERRGVKMTPLPFLLKAAAAALRAKPNFNVSLSVDGEQVVYKDYVHIGIAVDTPAGLVVPVLRDVDKKSLWQLAQESAELAEKAKNRKLKPADMQGGCFTISSLGNIGGTGFTPIINSPEVAILGVSKLAVKPVWDGDSFQPRKMLPLSLSYDHRAINGAEAGAFLTFLNDALADIRRLLL